MPSLCFFETPIPTNGENPEINEYIEAFKTEATRDQDNPSEDPNRTAYARAIHEISDDNHKARIDALKNHRDMLSKIVNFILYAVQYATIIIPVVAYLNGRELVHLMTCQEDAMRKALQPSSALTQQQDGTTPPATTGNVPVNGGGAGNGGGEVREEEFDEKEFDEEEAFDDPPAV